MQVKTLTLIFIFALLAFLPNNKVLAHPGGTASDGCHYCRTNCAKWGEVYGARHCHNGVSTTPTTSYQTTTYTSPTLPSCPSNSYYSSTTDSCTCISGYVMSKNLFGEPACVSGSTICHDEYGFNSRYDSLSESCECSYGYVMGKDSIGKTQCISRDTMCRNQLGTNSKYDVVSERCECTYGNIIDNGKCTSGNIVCYRKHGIHSDFNGLDNSCECEENYTLDDNNQCVKKQNNVYFSLIELDAKNRDAIIKSDYDYRYHEISYGIGCLATSIEKYVDKKIIVNLGTDYYVDNFDTIVLQDHDQECDILSVSFASSNSTLFPEPEKKEITSNIKATNFNSFFNRNISENADQKEEVDISDSYKPATHAVETPTPEQIVIPWYERILEFFINLFN